MIRAILQGMTGAGLFRRLHYPGGTDEYIGTETAEEVRLTPEYQGWSQEITRLRNIEATERELAEYYAKLYRTDVHEHTQEGTCAS
jgi:hypothetical protein